MQANPNIQKTVPVKKNGYILELQVPSPDERTSNNSNNQLTDFNQVQAQIVDINSAFNQNQNNYQIPIQDNSALSDNNKAFSFRNFFNR
jgi:hypothetical protein